MTEVENLILEHLRALRAGQDRIVEVVQDLMRRMTSLEEKVSRMALDIASLHADFAGQSLRIDRVEARLERIERRLDLVPSAR